MGIKEYLVEIISEGGCSKRHLCKTAHEVIKMIIDVKDKKIDGEISSILYRDGHGGESCVIRNYLEKEIDNGRYPTDEGYTMNDYSSSEDSS